MSTRKLDDIETAIENLPIDDENKEELVNFARGHRQEGLKSLVAKIKPADVEKQDTADSSPAVIPQASQPAPQPMNIYQMQQQQQQQQPQPPILAAGFSHKTDSQLLVQELRNLYDL
ncbi:MAG: hypothetical protein GTO02_19080 [Candidatus Dadabacteria bacterium]|nr:hypothetical protein [Candidatus Dadabacteria bacterium]